MTTTTEIFNRFLSIRREYGITASHAFTCVKDEIKKREFDFTGDDVYETVCSNSVVTVSRGKFTITIQAEHDEFADTSCVGEYKNRWEDGAIRVPDSLHDSNLYDWFVPTITEQEHYDSLRKLKFGKTVARELARSYPLADMKRLNGFTSFVVVIKVYVHGVELGSDSLGGIDMDVDGEMKYLADVVYDHGMIDTAIDQANKTLAELAPKSIHIEGRRWFQRLYGNTYHSVRVWVDGELELYSGETYGYGDQYLQTAFEWLFANGYANQEEREKLGSFTRYLREVLHGTYSVVDVERKKDL